MLRTVLCAAVLLMHPALAVARDTAPQPAAVGELGQRIDAMVARNFPADKPGATVIVVKDGRTVLRKAYGLADAARKTPMTADMTLRIGSITKQFTAVAILLLAEEGKLSLDDPVTRFLPDYPMQGRTITIEHLLTHSSGIVSYTNKPEYWKQLAQEVTVEQMIDSFKNDPLEFEPGTRFHYNNSGYYLLGAVIEKLSGQPYARFLEQRIFTPLGMRDTAYEGQERSRAPRAAGHTPKDGGFGPAMVLHMSQPYAAGALVSTVDDLAKWDAAIAAGKLLSPASWRKAFTSYRLASGAPSYYGYGWDVLTLQGVPMIGHGNATNGYLSYALRLPEQKIFVAVLTNTDGGVADPTPVAKKAAAIALGKPYPEYKEIKLDAAALDALAGEYELDKKETQVFRSRDGGLVMERLNLPPIQLRPYSATGFFRPGSLWQVEFSRDAQGRTRHVRIDLDGRVERHARIGAIPPGR